MQIAPSDSLYATRQKDRTKAEKLWEAFNCGDIPDGPSRDPYLRLLWSDWRRCRTLGISSAMQHGVLLPEEQFSKALENGRFLLEQAAPLLSQAQRYLANVPGILILADGDGTILHIAGDSSVRSRAARTSNIVEGSQWREEVAGTNGIGTAIQKRTPVHIYSFEHYCEGWHRWTCAATPILDPLGQKVLGVVDFTTIEKDYRDSSVALTYGLAGQIQRELLVRLASEHSQLLRSYEEHVARFPSDRIFVLDRMGHVVRSTSLGEEGASGNGGGRGQSPKEVRRVCSRDGEAIGSLVVTEKAHSARPTVFLARGDDSSVRSFGGFLTGDEELKSRLERLGRVVATDMGILLIGETGTGKEVLARYIHDASRRNGGPFVAVNCGAISKELFESRFFGYERGAFTGADPRGRKGFFEQARGGTLFLDEIGEMPLDMQVGLLRVLESNRIRRIGAQEEIEADCRIVAATNQPLAEIIEAGRFRSDLYYRLGVFTLHIPPLRKRRQDVRFLAEHLMESFCEEHGVAPKQLTPAALDFLLKYDWPGNGRQLRNLIAAAMVCAEGPIERDDLAQNLGSRTGDPTDSLAARAEEESDSGLSTIREQERELILAALEKYRSVSRVCRHLGMSRSTIYRRFRDFGIDQRQYLD